MAQQTAVDWLMSEMLKPDMYKIWPTLLERAKEIEKNQIINACDYFADYPFENKDFEEYYNETYNK